MFDTGSVGLAHWELLHSLGDGAPVELGGDGDGVLVLLHISRAQHLSYKVQYVNNGTKTDYFSSCRFYFQKQSRLNVQHRELTSETLPLYASQENILLL